jgi:3-mercaptopyruvate sulfurtransferase SseA
MSPRAAWQLEALGFSDVYDYAAGKLDWISRGGPTEGNGPTIRSRARRPTGRPCSVAVLGIA